MTCFDDGECGSCDSPCPEALALAEALADTVEIPVICGDCHLQEVCCRDNAD